jgi:CHAT domain-containing protein
LLTDGFVDYVCADTASGFGRTCGYVGYSECACKAGASADVASLCSDAWAVDAASKCRAIGSPHGVYLG